MKKKIYFRQTAILFLHFFNFIEVPFLEILNDHYLTQMNYIPTRGDRALDLVITNVPDQVCVRDVLSLKIQEL